MGCVSQSSGSVWRLVANAPANKMPGPAPPGAALRLLVYYLLTAPAMFTFWVLLKFPPTKYLMTRKKAQDSANAERLEVLGSYPHTKIRHIAQIMTYSVLKKASVGQYLLDVPLYTLQGDTCRLLHLVTER